MSSARELIDTLSELLGIASWARIYDHRGKTAPVNKRRDRVVDSLLATVTAAHCMTRLVQALRLRPDTQIMYWMQPADLWIEFTDASGTTIVTLGLLRPGWVRWDPYGDLELADPALAEDVISTLVPERG
jgi:hypothetical protein